MTADVTTLQSELTGSGASRRAQVLQLRDDGKTSRWLVERRAKARAEAEMKAP